MNPPGTPLVNGQVPALPKLDHVFGVPPVLVRAAVGETHQLAPQDDIDLEQLVEEDEPKQMGGNLQQDLNRLGNSSTISFSQKIHGNRGGGGGG